MSGPGPGPGTRLNDRGAPPSLRSSSPASSSPDRARRLPGRRSPSPPRLRSASLSSSSAAHSRPETSPASSVRSARGAAPGARVSYQPTVPSHLHTAVFADDASDPTSDRSYGPAWVSHAGANGGSNGAAPHESSQPGSSRRQSHDRRVRSEAGPYASYIARGKRPSIVTGGYESTDDDDDSGSDGLGAVGVAARSAALAPLPSSRSAPRGLATQMQDRHAQAQSRRRAQSLMSPLSEDRAPSRSPTRRRGIKREASSGLSAIPTRRQASDGRPTTAAPRFADEPQRAQGRGEASPSNGRARADADQAQKKGKSRIPRDESRAALAASLGLLSDPREATLTPDQINELFNDSSVASALRMMGNPPVRNRRISHVPDLSVQTPSPASSQPFLATAPPPLMGDDGDRRARTVSMSSSIAPEPAFAPRSAAKLAPASMSWPISPAGPSASSAWHPSPTRRRRESSVATLDGEGGHVPFTHHVQPILSESEHTDTERSVRRPDSVIDSSAEVDGRVGKPPSKGRLAHLLRGKSGKKRDGAAGARSETDHEAAAPTTHTREREREREAEYEAYMRRKEAERREAELAQERQLRALTQVHAHPESQQKAQRASTHLDAYYDHVYDGLENPPRLNLLAVLRWKQRVDEQKAAKRRWEAEHGHRPGDHDHGAASWLEASPVHESPTSMRFGAGLERQRTVSNPVAVPGGVPVPRAWQYTLEDVAAYKACEGRVDVFVPPYHSAANKPVSNASDMSSLSTKDPAEFASPSLVSLQHSTPDGSIAALSRSTSRETSQKSRREHQTHRPVHSLGSLPPSSLGHAIRAPFENLKNATRKQRTMPTLHSTTHTHAHNSPIDGDDSSGRERAVHARSMGTERGSMPKPASLTLFRRHDPDTDDEHHQFRRLFAKPSRVTVAGRTNGTATPTAAQTDSATRVKIAALRAAFEREAEQRRAQANLDEHAQSDEERARQRELDDDTFVERLKKVSATRQRLEHYGAAVEHVGVSIEHYVSQMAQIEKLFQVSADVVVSFPNLDQFRPPARLQSYEADEEGDTLTPLRAHDSASGSEAGLARHPSRRLARRPSNGGPGSPGVLALPSLSFALVPFPRRTSIDPLTTARVDPIARAELAVAHARDRMRELDDRRRDATRKLQSMIGQIDALIKQKDVVRAWSKTALDNIHSLNEQLEGLRREINSSSRARMGRMLDSFYDGSARALSPFVRSVFRLTFVVWRPHARAASDDAAPPRDAGAGDEGADQVVVVHGKAARRGGGVPWSCALVVLVIAVVVSFFIIGGLD